MENAILKHNSHWNNPYKNIHKRNKLEYILDRIHLKQIHVLTGIRRSGKTTLFKLIINDLITHCDPKSILYINLDDPFFSELYKNSKSLYKLLELSEKLTSIKVQYIFFDEIQNVLAWEKFIKSIYDNNIVKKIFVTGSNSSLLDGEYATLLSGRYIKTQIHPPNFNELLKFKSISNRLELFSNKTTALKTIDSILEYGSFFEVIQEKEFKRDIILSYYETIVYKDCIANNNLRDSKSFKELLYFYISNSTNLYSYNSISKNIGINDNTVKEYINTIIDSFICCEIKQFSYSLKQQIKHKKKSYVVDNSFLAQISFRFSKDTGKLFENLVFTELYKKYSEIYFISTDTECDFICKHNDEIIAIQVCYDLHSQNLAKEFKGLQKLQIKCKEKVIITYNQSEEIIDDILVIPFWDYFSEF
ncbi:MAG: AAA family ATPase [Candidatus Cloacimonadota bacterium]|nr:MAG: AAA family ATPase [Candidatus Cloacimonadota bacterium]